LGSPLPLRVFSSPAELDSERPLTCGRNKLKMDSLGEPGELRLCAQSGWRENECGF
jgi:hypothetical protein